jgi:hypothetical protein
VLLTVSAFIALVMLACRDSSAPAPAPGLTLCAVPLTVSVTSGTTPVYRWTPPCGATYLEVTSPDRQHVFWIVRGDTGKFGPGVQYGVAPSAFTTRFGPLPLTVGASYLVRIGIMVDEDSFFTFGEGSFTY